MTKRQMFDDMMVECQKSNDINEQIKDTLNESQDQEVETDSKLQKILNKLMSEEKLTVELYTGMIIASTKEEHQKFKNLFLEIAKDEEQDHFISLLHWAKMFGYAAPFKHSDFEKFASKNSTKQINSLKQGQEALYYVGEAMKSEEDAIKSYTEAMEYENMPYELNTILLNILEDEKEHLEKLNTLKLALEADATLYLY